MLAAGLPAKDMFACFGVEMLNGAHIMPEPVRLVYKRPLVDGGGRVFKNCARRAHVFQRQQGVLAAPCAITALFGVDTHTESLRALSHHGVLPRLTVQLRGYAGSPGHAVSCAHVSRLASFRLAGLHPVRRIRLCTMFAFVVW